MLKKFFLLSFCLSSPLFLAGCSEHKYSYVYLMQHPEQTQRYYNQCVAEVASTSLPCEMITRAQADFTVLVNRHDQDPVEFGRQLLLAEENADYFKQNLQAAIEAYHIVGAKKPGIEEMRVARAEVDKAQAAYDLGLEKVRIMLAVIAETSPV